MSVHVLTALKLLTALKCDIPSMTCRGSPMDAVNTFRIITLIDMSTDCFTFVSGLLIYAVFCLYTLVSVTS